MKTKIKMPLHESILGASPFLELVIRNAYYSKLFTDNRLFEALKKKVSNRENEKRRESKTEYVPKHVLFDLLNSLPIENGDILIVHSSMDTLSRFNINSIELIEYLRIRLGEQGTLVIPAFPLYNERSYNEKEKMFLYDTKRTLCSTGMLPNVFLRIKDTVRSPFPWNSLAALGSHAELMMRNNLNTDLAHGRGSAWGYCYENNAKVLLLGVKSSHTTTIVHVAEDYMDENWPISDWFEKQSFILKNENITNKKEIRIRKQFWAKYNASWYRTRAFKQEGLLAEWDCHGANIGYINSSADMVDYVIERTRAGKPFFVVPRKYYR